MQSYADLLRGNSHGIQWDSQVTVCGIAVLDLVLLLCSMDCSHTLDPSYTDIIPMNFSLYLKCVCKECRAQFILCLPKTGQQLHGAAVPICGSHNGGGSRVEYSQVVIRYFHLSSISNHNN